MKLVSIEIGRAIQLFAADEVGPIAGLYLPELFQFVSGRYGFIKHSDVTEASKTGAKFEQGQLKAGEKNINIKELSIHNDGIIVDTFNTDDSSTVVDDLFNSGKQTFRFRDPETKLPRRYVSHVVVDFNRPIDNALKGFEAIRRNLSSAYKNAYGADVIYDMSRIALAVDPQNVPQQTATEFIIERRVNVPHSKNRFYCVAPLPTQTHLALLETIEREFGG